MSYYGGTECLVETVGFKKTTECDEQAQMPEESEFHTEGAANDAKTAGGKGCVDPSRARGTDSRLVLEERTD